MTEIRYQDEWITEYADGTEEVRFSDAEWAMMMEDPVRFGYACPSGHAWSAAECEHGHCNACIAESEADPCDAATNQPDAFNAPRHFPRNEKHDGDYIPF